MPSIQRAANVNLVAQYSAAMGPRTNKKEEKSSQWKSLFTKTSLPNRTFCGGSHFHLLSTSYSICETELQLQHLKWRGLSVGLVKQRNIFPPLDVTLVTLSSVTYIQTIQIHTDTYIHTFVYTHIHTYINAYSYILWNILAHTNNLCIWWRYFPPLNLMVILLLHAFCQGKFFWHTRKMGVMKKCIAYVF